MRDEGILIYEFIGHAEVFIVIIKRECNYRVARLSDDDSEVQKRRDKEGLRYDD